MATQKSKSVQPVADSPDAYIATLPEWVQADIKILDKKISRVMKGLPRVLWSGVFWGGSEQNIIGYGQFDFGPSNKKAVRWFMVGLAAQKNYISVYVNAVDERQYITKKYAKELGKVKVGASSISFGKLADVRLEKLLAMIARARELLS